MPSDGVDMLHAPYCGEGQAVAIQFRGGPSALDAAHGEAGGHAAAKRVIDRDRRDKRPTGNEQGSAGMASVGSGAYTYEPVENWAKLPPGWSFKEIGGVGVDRHDNVFVFNRGEHPMIVFDCDGNFLRSFGEGMFPRAHGVFMAPDDTIWLTDDGDHTVRQCTLEGKVL